MINSKRLFAAGIVVGLAAPLVLLVSLGVGLASASPARPAAVPIGVTLAPLASGFHQPDGIVFTGVVSDTRMFVVERYGLIRILEPNGTILATPFLSVTDKITQQLDVNIEAGLVGLVFSPDYATSGFFYIYYTHINGDLQLSRYQVSADPNVADPAEIPILTIPHPSHHTHNGGTLVFGPDGDLYLGPGDGGGYGDDGNDPLTGNDAQRLNSLLGKILRLNVTGVPTYTIPATNPFTQTVGARPEIWAWGLRNPWRFSFDRVTHDLFIGDVGEDTWEEVDYQPAASTGGENYGWRCYGGNHVFPSPFNGSCGPATDYVTPVAEYQHSATLRAVMGGYVYRGSQYPALDGYYFFADYSSGDIMAMQPGVWQVTRPGKMNDNPTTFGQDPQGELYMASLEGNIYRLEAVPSVYLPLLSR